MEKRYKIFTEYHVRNIKAYNTQAEQKMPYIVIVIDELSELMKPNYPLLPSEEKKFAKKNGGARFSQKITH